MLEIVWAETTCSSEFEYNLVMLAKLHPTVYSSNGDVSLTKPRSLILPQYARRFQSQPNLSGFLLHHLCHRWPSTLIHQITSIVAIVTIIVAAAVKNVNVDTAHPNSFDRSSHLSLLEGQMSGWKIGERIGKAAGLGRQTEDYFGRSLAAWRTGTQRVRLS